MSDLGARAVVEFKATGTFTKPKHPVTELMEVKVIDGQIVGVPATMIVAKPDDQN